MQIKFVVMGLCQPAGSKLQWVHGPRTVVMRLGPPLAKRRMRFKTNSRGTRLLVAQMKQFPLAEHDDGPDALEMARRIGIELFNERQEE